MRRARTIIEFIFYKTYVDIRTEATRSYLGLLWWIAEPVLYLGAFYILFVEVLHRDGQGFVPMFLCGAVVWKWFDNGVRRGAIAINQHRGLLQQVYVPKYIFPVILVLESAARFVPVFLVLLAFLWAYGIAPQGAWLSVPLVMAVQFLLVVSVAMLAGAVVPFLPDLKMAIDNGMILLMFLSGVFFNMGEVNEPLRSWLMLNPMAAVIDEYRHILLRGQWPDAERLAGVAAFAVAVAGVALVIFRRMDFHYARARF